MHMCVLYGCGSVYARVTVLETRTGKQARPRLRNQHIQSLKKSEAQKSSEYLKNSAMASKTSYTEGKRFKFKAKLGGSQDLPGFAEQCVSCFDAQESPRGF